MKENDKLSFLIVGSQKSGTSALDKYLREHSQIEMAKRKELHFFDNENNFLNSVDYDSYHKNFSSDRAKIKGECTPIYMYWTTSISRIYEYNPQIKIIAILRNPITRAFSHWNMERDRNTDSEEFSIAIRSESKRCRPELPLQHRVYSYVDRGFYSEQIRRIWRFFPKEQTHFIKHDDLLKTPHQTLNDLCRFLNVTPFESIVNKKVHSRPYINNLSNKDFIYLKQIYLAEIHMIENMLNWDCSNWIKKPSENKLISWFKRN